MLLFLVLLVLIANSDGKFYKTNVTDFKKCNVYYSRYGSLYKDFFHINDQNQSSVDNETLFDFHFTVLAIRDAHILLSPSSVITTKDPVYEIVIGAGGNSFSDIRRQQKSQVRASIRRNGLLSGIDERSFWIHVYKDGTINVGIEGEELPFIAWLDPDPLPIQVFSFATFGDTEAKWYYNCPRENTTIEEVKLVLTDVVQLRKHLLTGYNPFVRPVYDVQKKTAVSFKFSSSFISLDEISSVMNVKGIAEMTWTDEKIKWEPEKYGNITNLHVHHGEVWRPEILIWNSKSPEKMFAFHSSLVSVTNEGMVRWSSSVDAYTLCDISDLSQWPKDVHICDLVIAFRKPTENLQIQYSSKSNILGKGFANGWMILESTATSEQDKLHISISLQRSSNLYKKALFTPYWVIATMGLLTFCASPIGSAKMTFCCVQLILTAATLIATAVLIPGHPGKLPFLVFLYAKGLADSVICVFLTVVVINLARNEKSRNPPHCVTTVLNSYLLECLCLLPKLEVDITYNKVEKKLERETKVQETWMKLANFIDRIAFILYLILHLTIFFIKY